LSNEDKRFFERVFRILVESGENSSDIVP